MILKTKSVYSTIGNSTVNGPFVVDHVAKELKKKKLFAMKLTSDELMILFVQLI